MNPYAVHLRLTKGSPTISRKFKSMDTHFKAQDVIRCDICETSVPLMHCELCYINLCKACVVEHLYDESKEHKLVSFSKRESTKCMNYPKCQKHPPKTCELYCQQCDIPICASCVSAGDHEQHKKVDISEKLTIKKELIEKDLREMKQSIYPKLQEAASNISIQREDVSKESQKLSTALNNQREALHKEIDTIIQDMQSEIDDMDAQLLEAIAKQEEEINSSITEITQAIQDLQNLLDSSDGHLISGYTSRNEEFRSLPSQFHIIMPTFIPQEINREQIYQQFGILSKLAITYPSRPITTISGKEHGGNSKTPAGVVSFPLATPLTDDDEPQILAEINTGFGGWFNRLFSVSCVNDEEFWAIGNDKTMKLLNLDGDIVRSVQTKSGKVPQDIAVTRSRDLVYTDYKDSSINLVGTTETELLISLQGWKPYGVCSSSSDGLLVIMDSNNRKESKVVRYSGSTEKRSIQWDDEGQPLFSSGLLFNCKYLAENRNFDICVSDNYARAVVVVSAVGKLRFRYTGPPSCAKTSFDPRGITTDSQGRILTADCDNDRIHILDQDGLFLGFYENSGFRRPWGLCSDSRDNLFVAEIAGKVKKIQFFR